MAEPNTTTEATDGSTSDARRTPPATAGQQQPPEKNVNARIDGEVAERAMNAFYGARRHTRWRDYVEAAVEEYTTKLEQESNGGKPFPERPSENLPRGRKVGSTPARSQPH